VRTAVLGGRASTRVPNPGNGGCVSRLRKAGAHFCMGTCAAYFLRVRGDRKCSGARPVKNSVRVVITRKPRPEDSRRAIHRRLVVRSGRLVRILFYEGDQRPVGLAEAMIY